MDKPDLTKIFNALPVSREVFACWFILQHCYAYRPFITKSIFTKEFEGDIHISLLEVEEEQQAKKLQEAIQQQAKEDAERRVKEEAVMKDIFMRTNIWDLKW